MLHDVWKDLDQGALGQMAEFDKERLEYLVVVHILSEVVYKKNVLAVLAENQLDHAEALFRTRLHSIIGRSYAFNNISNKKYCSLHLLFHYHFKPTRPRKLIAPLL